MPCWCWHITAFFNNWAKGVFRHGELNDCIKLVAFVWLLIARAMLAEYISNACILSLSQLLTKSTIKCEMEKQSYFLHQQCWTLQKSNFWVTYWNRGWVEPSFLSTEAYQLISDINMLVSSRLDSPNLTPSTQSLEKQQHSNLTCSISRGQG